MISKFQREVTEWVRDHFNNCHIDGYDTGEANLGHLANMKRCNLRADILLWKDDTHALVVECHSELHDERGIGAFGGSIEDHHGRIGRDELKKVIITRLGFGLVEVWPGEDFQKKIKNAVDTCPESEISYQQASSQKVIIKSRPQWEKQKLETKSELPTGQQMPNGSGFEKGRKFK